MMMIEAEFSRPVSIEDVPAQGRHWTITASPAECQALAERYGIPEVERLEATLKVRPVARTETFKVEGTLTAAVVQTCVVSLEPVHQTVMESFSVVFGPDRRAEEGEEEGRDMVIDLGAEEPPDPIIDGKIDLGEVTAEHLALALDPFPRAEGAEMLEQQAIPEPEKTVTNRPFAVLAEFRDKKMRK